MKDLNILNQLPINLDWKTTGKGANHEEKEGHNLIVDTYSRFVTAMTLFGTFPINMDKKRNFELKFLSVRYAYSAVLCCLRLVTGIFVAKYVIGNMYLHQFSLEMSVFYGFNLSYPLSQLLLVLTFLEAPKVTRYLQDWTDYQIRFEKIAKRSFPKVPTVMSTIITVFLVFFVCNILFGLSVFSNYLERIEKEKLDRNTHALLMFANMCGGFSMISQTFFWFSMIYVLSHSAKVLGNEIESMRWSTDKSLKNHILLWYNLRQLCKDAGNVLCCSKLYMCGIILLYSVPSIYLGAVENPSNIVTAFFTLLIISLYAEIAHRAVDKVGPELEDKLMRLILSGRGRGYEQELLTFAQTIADYPPAIVLGGYFTLDRGINIPLYSSVATYLIVIFQFHQDKN